MTLQQLTCPQCGGNDLNPFGYRAFKCTFCGAVLKNEPEAPPVPPPAPPPVPPKKTHYSAPLNTDFRNTYRRYQDEDDDSQELTEGGFVKLVLVIGVIALVGWLLYWILG